MRKIEVTKEFLKAYNNLKTEAESFFDAINLIMNEAPYYDIYVNLEGSRDSTDKQNDFIDVWNGDAEYIVKEQLYYVQLINSEDGYLNKEIDTGELYLYTNKKKSFSKNRFAEKEIKEINLAYWNKAFLIKVEGE